MNRIIKKASEPSGRQRAGTQRIVVTCIKISINNQAVALKQPITVMK
jgi:hypothetical protein